MSKGRGSHYAVDDLGLVENINMAVPGNLTTLIKRLEAATSRLEDLTTASMGQNVVQAGQQSSQGGSSGVNYTSSAPPGSGATVKASDAPSLSAFEDLVNGPLKGFVEGAQPIGGVVQQQVRL